MVYKVAMICLHARTKLYSAFSDGDMGANDQWAESTTLYFFFFAADIFFILEYKKAEDIRLRPAILLHMQFGPKRM